jgi:uncharacterized membrane protein
MKRPKASPPVETRLYNAEQNRVGLERLMFFSDAVFAIAITILVLDIHLPSGVDLASGDQLLSSLLALWPKYLAYLISFLVIGLYWMNHHHKFLFIKKFDHLLLSLNLLFLMVIAFIPFPTAVMSETINMTSSIFYALVMAAAGVLLAVLWLHATRRQVLFDLHLSRQQRWREATGPLAIALIFLLSIGVAYVDLGLVRIFWLLIIPISLVLNIRREAGTSASR